MAYEIYRYVFIFGAVLAGAMLAITVAVFFILNIPEAIADLRKSKGGKCAEKLCVENDNFDRKSLFDSLLKEDKKTSDLTEQTLTDIDDPYQDDKTVDKFKIKSNKERSSLFNHSSKNIRAKDVATVRAPLKAKSPFVIECEITYIHTDEIIK